jgi:hypothetical protein
MALRMCRTRMTCPIKHMKGEDKTIWCYTDLTCSITAEPTRLVMEGCSYIIYIVTFYLLSSEWCLTITYRPANTFLPIWYHLGHLKL